MNSFLSGCIVIATWTIALTFAKWYRRQGEVLFHRFACAFFLLGIERIVLEATSPDDEVRPFVYLFRLVAFLTIAWAIVEKNRMGAGPRKRSAEESIKTSSKSPAALRPLP